MSEKTYVIYLSSERADRFRYSHTLENGSVTRFTVQYEALIEQTWYAIVRYDTAHGEPHKDTLHPRQPETKQRFPGYTNPEVLTLGERDLKTNWHTYRQAYEQELKK